MFSVIMAGGSGTRFWPASRERLPKQFLRITSEQTMFSETLARVRRISALDQTYAVVGRMHEELVSKSSSLESEQILIEPMGRNTAACIGLAAVHIVRRNADEPIVVLPADHFVADVEAFALAINRAAAAARSGNIVTLGITPTRPETGYGYIKIEASRDLEHGDGLYRMDRFVEKPDYANALKYLRDGHYLWNSGIFVFTARTILEELDICIPALGQGLKEIASAIDRADYTEVVARVYERLEPVSIDYGVMERTERRVDVLKAEFGWSDVGSWQALFELRRDEYDAHGNLLIGDVRALGSKRNLVYADANRLVALLGVEDVMVIDTPDALLIARLDKSQDIRQFPEMLKAMGRGEV